MNIKMEKDDKATMRRLIDQLNSRIPSLKTGGLYTLETALGPDYLADEEDSNNALGHYLSQLVSKGRAPFSFEGLTGDRHNKYRYNP